MAFFLSALTPASSLWACGSSWGKPTGHLVNKTIGVHTRKELPSFSFKIYSKYESNYYNGKCVQQIGKVQNKT